MTTYPTLREAVAARMAEWDGQAKQEPSLSYCGNELAGEVGEACNVIKKMERMRLRIAGSYATAEQLAEELADVVICADLIAMTAGIDLDAAVIQKFNSTSERYGLRTRMEVATSVNIVKKFCGQLIPDIQFWGAAKGRRPDRR